MPGRLPVTRHYTIKRWAVEEIVIDSVTSFRGPGNHWILRFRPPGQSNDRIELVLIEFQPDFVATVGSEMKRCLVRGEGVYCPVINDLLVVHPQTNAIIGRSSQGVVALLLRLEKACPPHAIMIVRQAFWRCRPVEIYLRVGARGDQGIEIDSVKILPRESPACPVSV